MTRASTERLGRYELMERLGHGGMAEVFSARLPGAAGVHKDVVIKRVLPHLVEDEEFISRFVTEAKVSAAMSHPNVVGVFEFGEEAGQYYLVMEKVDGDSLARVLDRAASRGIKTLWPATAVSIASHVLRGLHYAHTRVDDLGRPLKLVHRDVTPENVLLGFDGQVKLADFGVAKAAHIGRHAETSPGVVHGKAAYLSPEQARGEPLDARCDVFAVGVILFEMLCGRRPVEGTTAQVMLQLAQGTLPRPREVNPNIDVGLEAILLRALAPRAEDRFPSAQAFGEALETWRQSRAPKFRERWLQDLLAFLYRDELEAQGRTATLSDEALAEVQELIAPEAARATRPEVALRAQRAERSSARSERPPPARSAGTVADPGARTRTPSAALATAGVIVALAAVVAWLLLG